MSDRAPTLFSRLLWLLIGSIVTVMLLALAVLRYTARDVATDAAAQGLALRVAAADALLAHGARADAMTQLGVLRSEQSPAITPWRFPVMRRMEDDLRRRLPEREAHLQLQPRNMLWVRALPPQQGWIGLPISNLRGSLARATVVTLVLGTLVALLAAAIYARSLTAPLRQLAASASDIAAGAAPPPLPPRTARELRELDRALAEAAQSVRRAAAERELLLAALSHDLRTPLARLRLGLELSAERLDGDLLRGMESDIEAIDALAAQFVDFVRDGRDEPTRDVDLAALLRELADLAGQVGVQWQVDAPPTLALRGKPLALRRALDNLMQNAQRHGAPPFRAQLRSDAMQVLLSIIDAGPGAPPALLPRLGEPFLRGDEARGGGGSGLGLASVRRIATQHGGTLTLRNRGEGGFEALLALPRARASG